MRGAVLSEQQAEKGPLPPSAEGTPAQAVAQTESTVPSTVAAPSTALAPRSTARSPPGPGLGQGADSTGGPETPNRGG